MLWGETTFLCSMYSTLTLYFPGKELWLTVLMISYIALHIICQNMCAFSYCAAHQDFLTTIVLYKSINLLLYLQIHRAGWVSLRWSST